MAIGTPSFSVLACLFAITQPALADAAASSGTANKQLEGAERTTLTGDWGGLRPQLADDGITFRGDYVSESFTIAQGGMRKGTAYTQQVRAGFDLDMDRIMGWKGAKLHFTVNDRRGDGISSDFVGNRLPIQEAYGGQYTRLSEVSWEQDFAGGVVNMRLGYFAMGNDLGGISAGCAFVNAAFCAHPLSLSGDSDWYNYPNARWGAAFRIRAWHDLLIRTGVYQVNPALSEEGNAFKPFAGHTTGVILPVELEYTPDQRAGDRVLPGSYKFGFYYDTANAVRTPGPGAVSGRMGFYALASQMILREGDGKRGLSVMGAFTVNPRAAAQITRWYTIGLIQTGTFAGRDADTLGLGIVRAKLNPRIHAAYNGATDLAVMASLPSGETAIELSYGVQVNRWLLIRPDAQYIVNPGAFSNRPIRDALALGGQVKMQF
ncbi:MAG: carbohydrate porin [Sphingobium sp.]|nr:carbohydrate porin [Sphingobium sp.]